MANSASTHSTIFLTEGTSTSSTNHLSVIPVSYVPAPSSSIVTTTTTSRLVTIPITYLPPPATASLGTALTHTGSGKSLNSGAVAGIVVSVLAVITALVLFVAIRLVRGRRRRAPFVRRQDKWLPMSRSKEDSGFGFGTDRKAFTQLRDEVEDGGNAVRLEVESPTTPSHDAVPPVFLQGGGGRAVYSTSRTAPVDPSADPTTAASRH